MTTWSNGRAARKVALGYAIVVIVVFTYVAIQFATHDSPDASFAPVLAVGVTLPSSLMIVLLPDIAYPWSVIVGSAVLVSAALFQTWLLWLLFRGHRTR
ncbi:SCO4225 family membrane protein [Actinokineospora sp.]|uniref:SCO4225 family membrane protein n=1 Tax=Actinokineospora sp. TaxID=1872133 RepID=UPI0040377616